MLLMLWQSCINFTCTSFIVCYQTTHIVEIFHILQLFLIYQFVLRMVALRSLLPYFFPHAFSFHTIVQFRVVCHLCPVVVFLPEPVAQGRMHTLQ